MNSLHRFFQKLLELRLIYRVLIYFATVITAAFTIWCAVVEPVNQNFLIPLYVLAAILLTAAVFYLVRDIKYVKIAVIKPKIHENEFTNKVASDYRFRTFMFLIPGITGNIVFAAINAVNGIVGHSAWFGSLAAYYILLCMMRIGAGMQERRFYLMENTDDKKYKELAIYYRNSILFIFMAWVLGGLIVLLELSEGGKEYPGFTIYVMAAYVFYRFIMSTIQLFKVKKQSSMLLRIVRKIGYVDASVSVLTLQTALLAAFSNEDYIFHKYMNGATGTVVFLIVLGFGVQGVYVGRREKRKYDSYLSCGGR